MESTSTLHFGPFFLDGADDGLWCGSQRCKLTAKAESVLRYLVTRPGRLVRKADLLAAVWPDVHVSDWVLTTCIREIRQVLGDVAKAPQYIATVHRQGYRFIAPVTVVAAPPEFEAPPSPSTTAALEEEHKLVTLLCGALAEAPALAAQLGPEHWYRLLQTVAELTQEVLHPYAGTLLLSTGESFTAVFGAPVAQEDHARRAVVAALELRQRLQDTTALHAPLAGSVLTFGMGLHTGRVVVGGLGQTPPQPATAVGAPLHLATRLQQQAAPGMILLSAATYRLVHAEIRATSCGRLALEGQPTPVSVYAVQGLLRRHAGVAGRGSRAPSPFVGRERELTLLQEHLAEAMTGQGHAMGVVGPPGMGKTRLLTEFCRRAPGNQVAVYEGRCLSYGQATPYLPVRDLMQQMCGLAEGAEVAGRAAAVQQRLHASGITAEDDVALLLQLLDLPVAAEELEGLSPEARQVRTFALLRHLVLEAAQRQPLILVVENLHWSDPTSDAWLASLVERLAGAAVLLLGTYRPGYQPAWGGHAAMTQIALPPLRVSESEAVVQAVLGEMSLPEPQRQALVAQAGGNPFFLEELAWHAVEQGGGDTPEAMPETVHAVLAARMDRLPPEAKRLLQTAAVMGPEVPVPLLQAMADVPELALHRGLAHLQAAEFLYETQLFPDPVYTFKHALIQDAAYASLLGGVRQGYHQRMAQQLEARFPATCETQPELVAHHYTAAGCLEPAIGYWQRAGQQAVQRSAYQEAISHLTQGLTLLATRPDTSERRQQELALQMALGPALMMLKGYGHPDVEQAYARARALCQQMGETPALFPVLWGVWRFYVSRGALQTARELGEQLLTLAAQQDDPTLRLAAHVALGMTLYFLGAFAPARLSLEQGIAQPTLPPHRAADARYGEDPVGQCYHYLAWTLWYLGYPEQARHRSHKERTLAQALAHPATQTLALFGAARIRQLCREVPEAHELAEATIAFATEQGNTYLLAHGTLMRGWTLCQQGQHDEGLEQLHQGLATLRTAGGEVGRPFWLTMLAEAYGTVAQAEKGLSVLAEARTIIDQTGPHYVDAECHRIEGELRLHQTEPDASQAAQCFQQALDVARQQQAKSLELRAATRLARLWQQQNKRQEAHDLLAPVYDWFTEGLDTADLQDAQALLDELRA